MAAMMVDVADPDLVRSAVDGDVAAFTKLLRQHDDRMRAVAFRMVGSAAAMDDVLQVAYLNAHRGLHRFRAEADFGTWLHRIVVNAGHDHLRRLGRTTEVSLQVVRDLPSPGSMEDRLALSGQLHQALATLSPEYRAAVVLVDGEGLSYAEAAEILGVERGTVASRLNRARAQLRDQLSDGEGRRP
jgi:RNA polymerase sigma-70 factor (ECF subfamily)